MPIAAKSGYNLRIDYVSNTTYCWSCFVYVWSSRVRGDLYHSGGAAMTDSKQKRAAKADQLIAVLTMMTGLGIDDMLKELEGTDEEKAKAQMENVIKMAEHMKGSIPSLGALRETLDGRDVEIYTKNGWMNRHDLS